MNDVNRIKAEIDTLQGTVNQLNLLLGSSDHDFTEDQIVVAQRHRESMVENLKSLRAELRELQGRKTYSA